MKRVVLLAVDTRMQIYAIDAEKVQCILGPEFGSEDRKTHHNCQRRDSDSASLRCAYEINCARERNFPNKDRPKGYVNAYGKSISFRYLRMY